VLNNIGQDFIVQATVISVDQTKFSQQKGTPSQQVVLHDGQQQMKVKIWQGKGQPIPQSVRNTQQAFSLSSYVAKYDSKIYISGFWQAPLDAEQVRGAVNDSIGTQQPQQAPQQPAQRVGGYPVVNNPQIPPAAQKAIDEHLTDKEKNMFIVRECAIKAATDIVIANPSLVSTDIFVIADEIVEYIQTGRHPAQREETQEIPETEEPPF